MIGLLISFDVQKKYEINHCPTVIKSNFSDDYIIIIFN